MLRKAAKFHRDEVRPKPKAASTVKPRRVRASAEHTESRNESAHADKKASFKLEDSQTGRPSRKSTRGSSNRAKADSNLKRRQTRATTSAKSRARRGK